MESAEQPVRSDPRRGPSTRHGRQAAVREGKWTHVVFTFERFNTGKPNGVAHLYLDGEPVIAPPSADVHVGSDKTAIGLGPSYIGLLDELSIFNRAFTPEEVTAVYRLESGVSGLLR